MNQMSCHGQIFAKVALSVEVPEDPGSAAVSVGSYESVSLVILAESLETGSNDQEIASVSNRFSRSVDSLAGQPGRAILGFVEVDYSLAQRSPSLTTFCAWPSLAALSKTPRVSPQNMPMMSARPSVPVVIELTVSR